MNKRLVHIYTGHGKGKTTTAVGLAIRALGHGFKVAYLYFHKMPEKNGTNEIDMLKKLGATVQGTAQGHPLFNKDIDTGMLKQEALQGLELIEAKVANEQYDLLILDEVINSVNSGFLAEEQLLAFIDRKPDNLELIMTGRDASEAIIAKADYVSEIKKVKHPYDNNIQAREGIEY
jgi:cob(I)alamin adenosyltransferase